MGIDFVMILCFTALIVGYFVWLDLGFSGLCYVNFRCLEGIPGTILAEIGFFGLALIFD